MATEEGIVIHVGPKTARVKTTRSGACENCASKGSCSTIGGGQEMEIEALNLAGAEMGDRVVVEVDTASLLKVSFLLYVFPVLCLLLGAVLGQLAASSLGFGGTGLSVAGGAVFFALAFGFIKFKSNRLAAKDNYRPKVLRIIKRA